MASTFIDTGVSDELLLIKNNTFEKLGYEFVSWNTKPDGTGIQYLPNLYASFLKNITLYAQWKRMYTYMQLVRGGNISVASNIAKFGTNAYERTPIYFNLSRTFIFELLFKFTTGADISRTQCLFRLSETYNLGLYIENSKLVYKATNTFSNVNIAANTTYYMKVVKTSPVIDVYLSTDNNQFTHVMAINLNNISTSNEYFTFGLNKVYTVVEKETYLETVTKYQVEARTVSELRWITNNLYCTYGDKNGRTYTYEQKLQHKDRKNCGHWGYENVFYPASGPYLVTETKTRDVKKTYEYANFAGSIDFNESYFVLNGTKYKLRA